MALFSGFRQLIKTEESRGWPTITGKIVSSEIHSYRQLGLKRSFMYEAKIKYHYFYNGELYTANRVSYGYDPSNIRQFAQETVDKYHPNQKVIVYYDPQNPKESVLEPGVIGIIFVPILVGAFFSLPGICVLIFKMTHG